MMASCKIKPSAYDCRVCGDAADDYGGKCDCEACRRRAKRYPICGFIGGIFNDYALILKDGEIVKVSIDRIYGVEVVKDAD